MSPTLTLSDVAHFLDAKADDDSIGITCPGGGQGLIARVLAEKYPKSGASMVSLGDVWMGTSRVACHEGVLGLFDSLHGPTRERPVTKMK